eukprot:TRINITY_DN32560_c0_g1_i1.p1 TRINITY_DN32560_c0_g1~~TRINITY_DN32560_c0_g1_i1.p1  ORF type:complete len:282 (+),score=46.98 TRINITY_DN32560_c0_g1_i1:194-1039(+)
MATLIRGFGALLRSSTRSMACTSTANKNAITAVSPCVANGPARALHTSTPVHKTIVPKKRIPVPGNARASDIKLGKLKPNPGSFRNVKRRARGDRTAGRGVKGQGARSGKPRPGFEGGQTPLHMRLPKRGFVNPLKKTMRVVNLDKIQSWVDQGRIPLDRPLTMKVMQDCGLVTRIKTGGVKLLGKGDISVPLSIEVTDASKSAIKAVRKAGGEVKLVYYNRLGLRSLLKPQKFPILPKLARPPAKLAPKYINYEAPTPREHPQEWPELFGLEPSTFKPNL